MIARLLKLSDEPLPTEPDTGVVFDSPGIDGLVCYKIVVGGRWRGEGKMWDRDCDEEAVRRLWAQLDDCRRRDDEATRESKPVAGEAHHFPPQDLGEAGGA